MNVLGIETSCDETAAAVVVDGARVLSSVVASQAAIHHRYGGVVPELASRKHMEAIVPVVDRAIAEARLTADQIDAVAVTQGPGLVGALLVGFCFARAWAYARQLPWVGVNHLEGHIQSVFLSPGAPPFPFIALLVSGGHTALYHVTSHLHAELMGQTRDDAAGEAFDKVAKLLGLGYPGGQIIGELAERGDAAAISFPRPFLDPQAFDFSFSGLKSAVCRYVDQTPDRGQTQINDIAAGFQQAVIDVLVGKALHAAQTRQCSHIALVGGVACNQRLRRQLQSAAAAYHITACMPEMAYCGDNAAMIAAVGFHYLKQGRQSALNNDVYSRTRFR